MKLVNAIPPDPDALTEYQRGYVDGFDAINQAPDPRLDALLRVAGGDHYENTLHSLEIPGARGTNCEMCDALAAFEEKP